jgi:hypothetical protein
VFRAELSVAALGVGAALVLLVLFDAFETTVLSRRVSRGNRLTTMFYRLTWPLFRTAARRIQPGNPRENFLTVYGPLSLLVLIALWAAGLVVAFGLVHWAVAAGNPPGVPRSFPGSVYLSGTTLFTLGLGDVTPHTNAGRAITVLESGIGLGFLALMIAYLPVLSQAFSLREGNIALLDARAGSPPTAAELLRRHGVDDEAEALIDLLREWERWSAQLLESHVSFPVLAFYRSQHDNQSWVAGLTAILDTCALLLSSAGSLDRRLERQARLTFAMARHAVADMCRVLRRRALPIAQDRLPAASFERLVRSLAEAGGPQPDRVSRTSLDELRGLYEPLANTLSNFLLMPLPPWCPAEPPRDNWRTNV